MTTDPSQSSSYIFDPESPTEMARLIDQDRILTNAMGGPLVGIDDPSKLHTVLDLACGPGGWVLDFAFAQPDIEVAGVDISRIMVDYANARARTQNLTNASFGVMDITQPLDFEDTSFDLVNARFLFSVFRREAWSPFLAECFRVLKPGGIIRLTEPVDIVSNSPNMETQWSLLYRFLHLGGYGFSPNGRTIGVAPLLPRLLHLTGFTDLRNIAHVQHFSQGTEDWIRGYRNQEVLGLTMLPLFAKHGLITQEEATLIHQNTLAEWYNEDFCGMTYLHTALAIRP